MYGNGQSMGYSPRDIDDMSLWEYQCCLNAFIRNNVSDSDPAPAMGDDRLQELGIEGFD